VGETSLTGGDPEQALDRKFTASYKLRAI